jgi:hypothetical protein
MLKNILRLHRRTKQEVLDFFIYGGPQQILERIGFVVLMIIWVPACAIIWILTEPLYRIHRYGQSRQETKPLASSDS